MERLVLREAMPRPALFVRARLRVEGPARPPDHAVTGSKWWHVSYSDGRRRVMSERTLSNRRLFEPVGT